MTPKEQYDERRRQHKERMMEENRRTDARQQREELADVAITAMLTGVKAFFEGRARLHIEPMKPGIGQEIRFVLETPPDLAKDR